MYQASKSLIQTFQFSFGSRCQSTSENVDQNNGEAQKPANRKQNKINGSIEVLSKDNSFIENKMVGDISTFDTTDENKPFSFNETYSTRNDIDEASPLVEKQKDKYIINQQIHEDYAIHTLPINKSGDVPVSQQNTISPLVVNYCEQPANFSSRNITNKHVPQIKRRLVLSNLRTFASQYGSEHLKKVLQIQLLSRLIHQYQLITKSRLCTMQSHLI